MSVFDELLRDKDFRQAVSIPDTEYEMSKRIIDARIARGLSQAELARLTGTKQSSIARLESGVGLPSITTLQKIAKALKTRLVLPAFEFMQVDIVEVKLSNTHMSMSLQQEEATFDGFFGGKFSPAMSEWSSRAETKTTNSTLTKSGKIKV